MSRKRFSPKSRNALVVLGMHRSGTSALAGVLSRLGCDLPNTLMPANAYNEKGYYESLQLYQMNDAILASGGARWDDWQPFNPEWIDTHRAEEFLTQGAEVLEAEFGTSRLFVLKDPRICLVMPFWTRLFEQTKIKPTYVHIHRNPVAVATSLHTRDGLPLPYGMLLWLRHTLDAESGSRGAPRCFTTFDRLLDNWNAVTTTIKTQTGVVFPRSSDAVDLEIDTFLSPEMNNSGKAVQNTKDHPLLTQWIGQIYDVLERWAESGEDAKDFAVFDAVRAEFDATAPLFGKLVREARTATQHKEALDAATAELVELREEAATQNARLQDSIRGYEQQAQDVVAQLKASEAASQTQIEETQALRTAHEEALQKLAKAKKKQKSLQSDLSARTARIDALEEQRRLDERTHAELVEAANRSAQELEKVKLEFTALDQAKWQIQSELAQRVSETEDLSQQNAAAAARVNELTAQLSQLQAQHDAQAGAQAELRKELETQQQANQQQAKAARVQRATLQAEFEKTLETTLVARRKSSDQQIQTLTQKEAELRAHAEEVSNYNGALLNSTSWKITKPLRSLVLLFRRH